MFGRHTNHLGDRRFGDMAWMLFGQQIVGNEF